MPDDIVDARLAGAGDGAAVEGLRARNHHESRSQRGGDRYAAGRPKEVPTGATVLVGTIDGCVVGYATLRKSGDAAVLDELFVEPEARKVGVGNVLVELAVELATGWGCRAIESVALPGDRHTKNFFEAHGMVSRLLHVSRPL